MTIRHMKIFMTVCDCKSATAAAEKLGIAQPAVSLAIKELEDYYGIQVFDRVSHRLYITEEGEKLLQYARRIVSLFDSMEYDIKDLDSFGILRIGSSITIGTCLMPDYVKRFKADHPNINVYVSIENSSDIEKRILENQLDFAMVEGNFHSGNCISRRFMSDRLVMVCGTNGLLMGRTTVAPEELPGLPFLLREKGSGTRELFDSVLLSKGLAVMPEWESVSTRAIICAVQRGLGVSVLPYRLVESELTRKTLTEIEISDMTFERSFNLIYHKDKHLSKSALAFLESNGLYDIVKS